MQAVSELDARRVPIEQAATPEEISLAIESLTEAELVKVRRFAAYRVRALGPEKPGRAADELIKEALLSLLEGNRRWNKEKVSFFTFLSGAMRSISSHWREQDLQPRMEHPDVLTTLTSDAPDPEAALNGKQQWALILSIFADDEDSLALLPEMAQGLSGPEVRARIGWTANRYEATLKRVRRKLVKGGLHELDS